MILNVTIDKDTSRRELILVGNLFFDLANEEVTPVARRATDVAPEVVEPEVVEVAEPEVKPEPQRRTRKPKPEPEVVEVVEPEVVEVAEVVEPEPEPEALEGEVIPADGANVDVTEPQVQQLAAVVSRIVGVDKIKALIAGYKVARISELSQVQLNDIAEKLEAMKP